VASSPCPAIKSSRVPPSPDEVVVKLRHPLRIRIKIARDGGPEALSRWLAQTPMSALGMNSPDRVFPALGGGK
jgi:hypothetical protein